MDVYICQVRPLACHFDCESNLVLKLGLRCEFLNGSFEMTVTATCDENVQSVQALNSDCSLV